MTDTQIMVKEGDIETVVQISAKIVEFDMLYDSQYYAERIAGKESCVLVAYSEDVPVGFIVAYDKDDDGSFYCWMAGVDPQFRRMGVLSALMRYLNSWAKKRQYTKIRIKTRNNRREMLAYLIKEGYYCIEVETYPHISDNRILFEKDIKE